MQVHENVAALMRALDSAVVVNDDASSVTVHDRGAVRADLMDTLAWDAAFGQNGIKEAAIWLIRAIGEQVGVIPASIHDYYLAAGRGEFANVTVPACNIRGMTYDTSRAARRAAQSLDAKALIYEIARSELGYTGQGPEEFAAQVLAANIREGYEGPVFIQGDHVQVSAKSYAKDADAEIAGMHDLIKREMAAGFYNIDIDTSTLVDLDKGSLDEQQTVNYTLAAHFTHFIRSLQFGDLTVSVGGEIGEVGGKNSTVEELHAFMRGYERALTTLDPRAVGISKISVQTGTSHGGIVLPDGTVKQVSVDFDTLGKLSAVAKREYGLGGAVQHGASTLPKEAFNEFSKANAIEVHLATGFQNLIFDHPALPANLKEQVYTWLRENRQEERKEGMTDEQFYYTTRKRGWGPPGIKEAWWNMPVESKQAIMTDLQAEFRVIFDRLGIAGTAAKVDETVRPIKSAQPMPHAMRAAV
ncbi:MAG: class II fructose-bisphosphate aldolase [Thermomicrobiales bacterium]